MKKATEFMGCTSFFMRTLTARKSKPKQIFTKKPQVNSLHKCYLILLSVHSKYSIADLTTYQLGLSVRRKFKSQERGRS